MIGVQVQKAIHDALKASPAVAGGNVLDRFDDRDPYPRVTIGEEQIVGDSNACGDGWEVYADVHIWSQAPGYPEAKSIAATVVNRVLAITSIAGFALSEVSFEDQRSFRDPDGLTSHVVCSFRFIIDQA